MNPLMYLHRICRPRFASSAAHPDLGRRSKAGCVFLLFALAASGCALAQPSSAFMSLEQHINKKVTVEAEEGRITGNLLRVDQSRIVVYEGGMPKTIARESVKKVIKHKSRHTAAWVAGMSAAGLGAGFLLGFSAFDDAVNANSKVGAAAAVGAGAGAAAGFGLSRIGRQEEVIYQSSPTAGTILRRRNYEVTICPHTDHPRGTLSNFVYWERVRSDEPSTVAKRSEVENGVAGDNTVAADGRGTSH